jgi:uncharacterized membrane protein YtjA (UPF0391 family)
MSRQRARSDLAATNVVQFEDVQFDDVHGQKEKSSMLYWAVIFLVVAIIAGIFGFGGISQAATGIAKILFLIFIVLFLVSLVVGYV